MAKSYTVTQRIYYYDAFEESDIPEGMTAGQYAEARYRAGYGDLDSHELMLIIGESGKEDVIIDPVLTEDDDFMGATAVEVDGTVVAFTRKVEL
jgi:hypothetical protein